MALGLSRGSPAESLGIKEVDPNEVLYSDLQKDLSLERPKSKLKWEEIKSLYRKRFEQIDVPRSCESAREFQQSFEFLQKQNFVTLPDKVNMMIAYRVSEGCTGAADRFALIFNLLIPSGVDKRKAIEIALHFSRKTDDQASAFNLLFKGTFLEKYWDLDFKSALATSLKVALNARGNPAHVAQDFRQVMNYCLLQPGLEQPIKTCAPYALELAGSSYLWTEKGLGNDFEKLIDFFKSQKDLESNAQTKLKLASQILSQGPKALENFKSQYNYGMSAKMHLPQKTAFELALKVAQNSVNSRQDWLDLQ